MDKLIINATARKRTVTEIVTLDKALFDRLNSISDITGQSVPYIIAECVKFAEPKITINMD